MMSYLIEPPVRVMPLTLSPREDQVTAINVVNNNKKVAPNIRRDKVVAYYKEL